MQDIKEKMINTDIEVHQPSYQAGWEDCAKELQEREDKLLVCIKGCLKDYRGLQVISEKQGWKETNRDVAESIEFIEAALQSLGIQE